MQLLGFKVDNPWGFTGTHSILQELLQWPQQYTLWQLEVKHNPSTMLLVIARTIGCIFLICRHWLSKLTALGAITKIIMVHMNECMCNITWWLNLSSSWSHKKKLCMCCYLTYMLLREGKNKKKQWPWSGSMLHVYRDSFLAFFWRLDYSSCWFGEWYGFIVLSLPIKIGEGFFFLLIFT